MSGNFDGVIRPFQLPDFSPPAVAPDQQYIPNRNPVLTAGAQGSAKTMSGSFNLTITRYMIRKPKEESSGGGGF